VLAATYESEPEPVAMPLHPAARQILDDTAASARPNAHLLPVPTARENFEALFASLWRPGVHEIRDVEIPVDGGSIPGRLYRPSEHRDLPLVVYYHGGGWLLGSVDSHDVATRELALASRCAVLSVGYRRGPEHRFPTAVDDAVAAVHWAVGNGSSLGIDPSRLAVAGDSAGGNLATVVAALLRDAGGPALRHQLLVYPVTTCNLDIGFAPAFEGYLLYRDEMQWHQDNYLADPAQATDPRVSPLESDLRGLPTATVLLAECDPIRPQGVAYIEALRRAEVPVTVLDCDGLVHGFFGLDAVFPEAIAAMDFAGARLALALGAPNKRE
jgi:acetyl esterase